MLIGRVGRVPEIKMISESRKAAQFSLATSEKYKDRNGELKENTEWHNIVAFDKTADVIEKYVSSGSQIFVEGKLRTRSWDDKDGKKRFVTEILVTSLQLLDSKKEEKEERWESPNPAMSRRKTTPLPPAGEPQDDDLPFA